MKSSVLRLFNRLKGLFPSPIPQGMTEFYSWADSIIDTYQPPADKRSVHFALATMIMRLDPTSAYKSKRYFSLCLHKGIAGQIANGVMFEIKEQQAAEIQAAKDAPPLPVVADDVAKTG